MWRWRQYFAKLYNFFHHARAERELAREVNSHLALLEEEFQRRGMTAAEAHLAARRAYGGVEQTKELHREERSILWLEQTLQDLRYALRSLSRAPGFTFVAILTLSLGIGVNATLFSAYNAVALKPLPVADPNQVVRIERWFESGSQGDMQYGFSYPEYVYLRAHNDVFSGLVAASWPSTVSAEAGPSLGGGRAKREKAWAVLVSANYFADLGIGARLGRTFLPEEDRAPGASPVIVISYPFWQHRFHGDAQAVGQLLKVNSTIFTIIGVAPENFTGTSTIPRVPDFWAPLSMQAQLIPGRDWLHQPDDRQFQILSRLKPAIALNIAQSQVGLLIHQYAGTYKPDDKTNAITLQRTALFGNTDDIRFKAFIGALMLIVGMVLMVACANVANMLLARGAARQKEVGVRLALGAGRGRIIRQLLTESALLAFMGGMGGLLLSVWTTKLLWISIVQTFGPFAQSFLDTAVVQANLKPDLRVLGYAFVLSLLTGLFFGLSPALQFSRPDLTSALKDEGTSLGKQWSRSRIRSILVAAQVGISMLLLISTGLLLRGLIRSQAADPGFETHGVFMLFADFGNDPAKSAMRQQRLIDRIKALPGIENVAFGTGPMMGTWTPPITIDGSDSSKSQPPAKALASYASDTYLDTLGIALLQGRNFTHQEATQVAQVAIISESTARRYWPHEDALGKQFKLDLYFREKFTAFEVVGIAKDIRFANLTRLDPTHIYVPAGAPGTRQYFSSLLLRSHGDPQSAMASVRAAVAALDEDLLPSLSLLTIEEGPLRLQKSLAQTYTMYAGMLALLTLTLAGVGIYGVMAYLVSQRVAEIGIHMALGATPAGVLKAVVVQGLQPVLAGLVLGLAGASALSWTLHTMLVFPGSADFFYGVPFYDPATFLGLSCFLVLVAVIASLVPARHALQVDPMVALRYQ